MQNDKNNDSMRELLAKWLVIGSIFHNALEENGKQAPYPLLDQCLVETVNYLNKEEIEDD